MGRPDPFGPDVKASDDFLDPVFQTYFSKLGLRNLMQKTDYHVLAHLVPRELIDSEISEKLDRIVEVERAVRVVEQVEVPTLPKGPGWVPALHELARQLDAGRVYDRDLGALADGLTEVLDAMHRRPAFRSALTAGGGPRA